MSNIKGRWVLTLIFILGYMLPGRAATVEVEFTVDGVSYYGTNNGVKA